MHEPALVVVHQQVGAVPALADVPAVMVLDGSHLGVPPVVVVVQCRMGFETKQLKEQEKKINKHQRDKASEPVRVVGERERELARELARRDRRRDRRHRGRERGETSSAAFASSPPPVARRIVKSRACVRVAQTCVRVCVASFLSLEASHHPHLHIYLPTAPAAAA